MSGVTGMTGFGRGEMIGETGAVVAEARSVNGKGLDVRVRLPAGFEGVETTIRDEARRVFNRGSVTVTITYQPPEADAGVQIDEARLKAFAEQARRLADQGLAAPATAGELLGLKGVVVASDALAEAPDDTALRQGAVSAAREAFESLKAARDAEGAAMAAVLHDHLAEIDALRSKAADHAEAAPAAIKARIKAKFDELLPDGLDPERLEQEAAQLAVKADIREELDRLTAHIEQAGALLAAGSPCGRKLDFLAQEFNREANTLCSKSADTELTRIGLELKAAVDRLREQVQNVE